MTLTQYIHRVFVDCGLLVLQEQSLWVAPISDSPKPPPCRVTITFPVINNARCAAFAACGSGKADMVKVSDGYCLS